MQLRTPNLTDPLRFLGALSIVWYHNPFYWNLGAYTSSVDMYKLALIGWAMPFFYASTCKFAIEGSNKIKNNLTKIKNIAVLIIFYTVIYQVLLRQDPQSIYTHCISQNACGAEWLFNTFRTVSNTPGYYLSDWISILLAALFLSFGFMIRIAVCAVFLCALILEEQRLWGYFLNPLAIGCFLWAFIYYETVHLRLKATRKFLLDPMQTAAVLTGLLGIWGGLNVLQGLNNFWYSGPGNFMIFGLLLLALMSLDKYFTPTGTAIALLSRWGQKYSFGIFILHQLCFDIFSPRLKTLLNIMSIHNDLAVFLMTGICVTAIALGLTILLSKKFPFIVHGGPSRPHAPSFNHI